MNPFSVITGVMLISVATYQPFLMETPNYVEVRGSVDAELGFPVELPPPVGISGSGALPGPVNLGPIEGTLASVRSEEHTSELQSRGHLVCRLLLEKKKKT